MSVRSRTAVGEEGALGTSLHTVPGRRFDDCRRAVGARPRFRRRAPGSGVRARVTVAAAGELGPLVVRLHRIEGQVRGIERMLQEGRACGDVLVQVAAARAALGHVAERLLEDHVARRLAEAIAAGGGDDVNVTVEETLDAVRLLVRSRS